MPPPIPFAVLGWSLSHHATRSTVEIAAAGAAVLVVLLAWIVVRRRRDPVGRSLAAYNLALTALGDSAARATTARPATAPPVTTHDPPQPVGVTIVTSIGPDG
jgi:uncharacterized protein (TIGR03382 family)